MKKTIGIRAKVIICTVLAMTILTAVISWIGYFTFNKNVLKNYVKYAELVIESANTVFDTYDMGDMIRDRSMGEKYEEARLELNKIKNNADIMYLYSVYFEDINDPNSICYAINAKNDEELNVGLPVEEIYSYMAEPCEEDAFADSTLELFRKCLLSGDTDIKYEESETSEYGRLITCYRAVFDSDGNPVGIIGADIDINQINTDLNEYLRIVMITALFFTLVIIGFFIFLVGMLITRPVESMAHSTDLFLKMMDASTPPEDLAYKKVIVKGHDEIHMLAKNIESLVEGVVNYMLNLKNVTAEKERIGAELNVATQIQADMLPRIFPAFPGREEFDIYASMTPAKEVGGDFYDLFLIDEDHIGLVMADVSGKGVPAALFMVIAKTLIKNRAMLGGSPSEVLADANEQLCEGNEAELFVTVWIAIIEISTGKGVAANAGHENPILRRKDGKYEMVTYRHSPAVATIEGLNFKQHEFEIFPGDTLFVYTDGVPEATNAHDELYGTDRLLDVLNSDPDADTKQLLINVKDSVDGFVGLAPQFDDITMLAFRYFGPK
ncbi:MAG: PP2C family protein-serine/threonine phosphatase [Lachnospiraceae bacterium]|nr:PP2C family protein-serine/threonine phosphatase [Lachnospiraceae bacterium]